MSAPTHAIKLKPFWVPNFVVSEQPGRGRGVGLQESVPIALAELSVEALEQLCAWAMCGEWFANTCPACGHL